MEGETQNWRALEDGYFTNPDSIDAPIQLIASYSPSAQAYFFPRRLRCPLTGGPVEDRLLSPQGTIYSWTYVTNPSMGRVKYSAEGGYGVAQVDFPEGPRVQGVILGSFGDWAIGQSVEVRLRKVRSENGVDLCAYAFVPACELQS